MMKKNSERNAAIRFMKKLFILFIPFIALLAVYFLDDPFMVLKNYERYDQTPVVLNEGHVGWQMYLNNRDTIPIDSYIMGNSCTMAYQCHEWEKYLHGGRAVRLFGNAESLAAVADDVRVSRQEIRRDYVEQFPGSKNYLFDYLPEDLQKHLQDVRMGNAEFGSHQKKQEE